MRQPYASVGARFGALLLDGLFINIACSLLFLVNPYLYVTVVPFASFLYYGFFEGSSLSATPGKLICGMVVVDEQGQKLTMGKGFLRSLCRLVSGLILGIGYLVALFNDENQALHDKMAGTSVVKANAAVAQPVAPQPRYQPVPTPAPAPMSTPKLIGVAGQMAGRPFPISTNGIILGTDSTACDLAFAPGTPGISRSHCKVQYNPQSQTFVLYDLGSSYGTFCNGVRVMQGQPYALRVGDQFYLATPANTFRVSL